MTHEYDCEFNQDDHGTSLMSTTSSTVCTTIPTTTANRTWLYAGQARPGPQQTGLAGPARGRRWTGSGDRRAEATGKLYART